MPKKTKTSSWMEDTKNFVTKVTKHGRNEKRENRTVGDEPFTCY